MTDYYITHEERLALIEDLRHKGAEADAEIERLRAERDALKLAFDSLETMCADYRQDSVRLEWLSRFIAYLAVLNPYTSCGNEESGGFEIYPIGPDNVYADDGNTVVDVAYYMLFDKYEVKTLREAIDARMAQKDKP